MQYTNFILDVRVYAYNLRIRCLYNDIFNELTLLRFLRNYNNDIMLQFPTSVSLSYIDRDSYNCLYLYKLNFRICDCEKKTSIIISYNLTHIMTR